MLNGVHFLLTYNCTYECDHCFLHCGPGVGGTFTIYQLRNVFDEIKKIKSIDNVYFEGGEPFLYYPLMLEGMRLAYDLGLKIGIVSNAYWANSIEDAQIWLRDISKLRLSNLSLSDDIFHNPGTDISPAKLALTAAKRLGIPSGTITIEEPCVKPGDEDGPEKGKPVIGGNALFKGRAADKLTDDLPRKPWTELTACHHEELVHPERVHVDCYGHVHICQGVSMGNMWETPLSVLVENYNADSHPICSPLVKGGPAELARRYELEHEETYVDECHFCYEMRKKLLDRFPGYLAPRQVYGLKE